MTAKNITASDYKKMRNLLNEFSSPNANKYSLKFGNIISAGFAQLISLLALAIYFSKFITSKVKSLARRRDQVQEPKTLFENNGDN